MISCNTPEHSLGHLQDLLRLAVATPGGLRPGLDHARQYHDLELPVHASDAGEAHARLAIYARGYLARLLEYLHADFPATHALLGDTLFDRFATEYLWSTPPRHYSLFAVADGFVAHLERTRPPEDCVPQSQRSWLQLPIDLARVEHARCQALRAPGLEGVAQPMLPGPWDVLLPNCTTVITAAPCLRIVAVTHDVTSFIAAVDAGIAPSAPPAGPLLLGISRHQFRPTLTPLTDWQAALLTQCRQPQRAMELVASTVGSCALDGEALAAELLLWLPLAQGRGLLTWQLHG